MWKKESLKVPGFERKFWCPDFSKVCVFSLNISYWGNTLCWIICSSMNINLNHWILTVRCDESLIVRKLEKFSSALASSLFHVHYLQTLLACKVGFFIFLLGLSGYKMMFLIFRFKTCCLQIFSLRHQISGVKNEQNNTVFRS